MQEGSFLDQACFSGVSGSCTDYAGFSSIYVDVQVEPSPYATGFELNGVSNEGDWFQSTVVENWCASGFVVANEIFNNAGTSVYGPCVSSDLTIRAGDTVQLGLYVSNSGSTSGDVCFTTADLTDPQTEYVNCQPQPDGGSSPASNYFAYGANGGFFTGPMTEIVDTSASSCESYTSMPTVNYQFVQGAYIVHFTPWSDEWYPPTDAVCYDSIGSGEWTMPPDNAAGQYVDASDASPYGPHWEAATNISSYSSTTWWQFSTDAVLPTPAATPLAYDVGQTVDVQIYEPALIEHIDTNPIYADWDYTVPGSWACSVGDSDETLTCTGTASVAGTYPIQFVLGETGGYSLSSPVLDFDVYSDPEIVSVGASPAAVDIGQTTALAVSVTLGSGGYTYAWQGLPGGCTSSSTDTLDCTPSSSGAFEVSVTATDSDGVAASSSPVSLTVDSDPTISIPTASPGSGGIDVGQPVTFTASASGGAGGFSYSWTGLPTGCSGLDAPSFACVPTASGTYGVRAIVTDANGYTVESSALDYSVDTRPSVSVSTTARSVDVGQTMRFDATVSGGSGGLTYIWSGLPADCDGASAQVTCAATTAGTSLVQVTVQDSNGVVANGSLEFTIYDDPSVSSFAASPNSVLAGQATQLSVVVVGGAPSLVYSYSGLPASCVSTDSNALSCSPSGAGTYQIEVTVTDANGVETNSSLTLVVNPSFVGLPAVEGYLLVFGFGALVLGILVVLLVTRRRRKDNDVSVAQRVDEYAPGARGSPVSSITIPASEAWSNRADAPPPGASGGSAAEGPKGPGYWDAPLISPPNPTCWNCKFDNPPASRYCAKCGLPLEAPPS